MTPEKRLGNKIDGTEDKIRILVRETKPYAPYYPGRALRLKMMMNGTFWAPIDISIIKDNDENHNYDTGSEEATD